MFNELKFSTKYYDVCLLQIAFLVVDQLQHLQHFQPTNVLSRRNRQYEEIEQLVFVYCVCMCLCMCAFVSMWIHAYMSASVYIYIYIYEFEYMNLCMCN